MTDIRIQRLLTAADLAERWSCEESTVHEHVRKDGLKFVPVGRKPLGRSNPGPKTYRFRLVDVEAWEEERLMEWGAEKRKPVAIEAAEARLAPLPVLAGIPDIWDKKIRGRKAKA